MFWYLYYGMQSVLGTLYLYGKKIAAGGLTRLDENGKQRRGPNRLLSSRNPPTMPTTEPLKDIRNDVRRLQP